MVPLRDCSYRGTGFFSAMNTANILDDNILSSPQLYSRSDQQHSPSSHHPFTMCIQIGPIIMSIYSSESMHLWCANQVSSSFCQRQPKWPPIAKLTTHQHLQGSEDGLGRGDGNTTSWLWLKSGVGDLAVVNDKSVAGSAFSEGPAELLGESGFLVTEEEL